MGEGAAQCLVGLIHPKTPAGSDLLISICNQLNFGHFPDSAVLMEQNPCMQAKPAIKQSLQFKCESGILESIFQGLIVRWQKWPMLLHLLPHRDISYL